MMENRFRALTKSKPEDAKRLAQEAQSYVDARRRYYEYMAAWKPSVAGAAIPPVTAAVSK